MMRNHGIVEFSNQGRQVKRRITVMEYPVALIECRDKLIRGPVFHREDLTLDFTVTVEEPSIFSIRCDVTHCFTRNGLVRKPFTRNGVSSRVNEGRGEDDPTRGRAIHRQNYSKQAIKETNLNSEGSQGLSPLPLITSS